MNVGILFSDYGPYHVDRIETLHTALKKQGSELVAFRFAKKSATYNWEPLTPKNMVTVDLAEEQPGIGLSAFIVAFNFGRKLKEFNIDVAFLPSYSPLINTLCLIVTKLLGCKAIMMCDSWSVSEKKNVFYRLPKLFLIRMFDAALVAGTPHVEFARQYGIKKERIFTGYDVVNVKYFAEQSDYWINKDANDLPVKNLPDRFFLNLGRFIPKKNLEVLVRAYAALMQKYKEDCISLVLVGDGVELEKIINLAGKLAVPFRRSSENNIVDVNAGGIIYYPFQQIDTTPLFFCRCEAFVLPSHYEEWGLVVNEAMSCKVPVIVSAYAGCAVDLVENNVNGYTFNPASQEELMACMEKFLLDKDLSKKLGLNAYKHIASWDPERFANGAVNSIVSLTN